MARKAAQTPIGKSTPVTLGLVFAVLGSISVGLWQGGRVSGDIDRLGIRVTSLELQNEKNASQNTAILSRLVRIETLLETADAKLGVPQFSKQ